MQTTSHTIYSPDKSPLIQNENIFSQVTLTNCLSSVNEYKTCIRFDFISKLPQLRLEDKRFICAVLEDLLPVGHHANIRHMFCILSVQAEDRCFLQSAPERIQQVHQSWGLCRFSLVILLTVSLSRPSADPRWFSAPASKLKPEDQNKQILSTV